MNCIIYSLSVIVGVCSPGYVSGKEPTYKCRSRRFSPWVWKKGMATYPSILVWGSQWTEEPGGLQSVGLQELDMTEAT